MQSWSRSALYDVAQGDSEGLEESPGALFLTLCSVPAPISLPESKSPAMQRYRFFFSKHQENGVERCWLHFGYFRTVEEARKWRDVLQRVYPGALIRSVPRDSEIQQAGASNSLSDSQVLPLLGKGGGAIGQPAELVGGAPSARRKPTLEDTLSELRDSTWRDLDADDDEVSSTGVRHLRVEIQARPGASVAKLHKAKRKS
jgi:hypothetical protein